MSEVFMSVLMNARSRMLKTALVTVMLVLSVVDMKTVIFVMSIMCCKAKEGGVPRKLLP
jgi:hypothetical protein